MKPIILASTVALVMMSHVLQAQINASLTQYTEILPLYNPAFSGIENHTDIRLGLRNSWINLPEAPFISYAYLSGNFPDIRKDRTKRVRYKSPYDIDQLADMVELPNNGLRTSNPEIMKRLVRDSVKKAIALLDRKQRNKLRKRLQYKKSIRS